MILIPGLMADGAVWDDMVARYRSQYEMHVLTLPGFAGVPPLAAGTPLLATVRDDIARYVRDRKLLKPVIVGHSLGGFLAFSFAASNPELAGHIVAVDGVPFLSALMDTTATTASALGMAERMRTIYGGLSATQLEMQSRPALMGMMRDTSRVTVAAKWAGRSDPRTVGNAVFEMSTTDLREMVAAIRTPVLLIGAASFATDSATRARTYAAYERQVRAIPNHTVILATDARHYIMYDDPAFLYATMDQFLKRGHQ
ncbi:MAG: alpha/beta hydrolase [bacterium]